MTIPNTRDPLALFRVDLEQKALEASEAINDFLDTPSAENESVMAVALASCSEAITRAHGAYEALEDTARAESDRKVADRVDGFDRDDLGESPDF